MSNVASFSPPECEPGGNQGGVQQASGPPLQNQCPDIDQKSKISDLSEKDKTADVLTEGLGSHGCRGETKGRRSPRPPVPGGEDLQPSHHSSDWGKPPTHHFLLSQLDYSHFHGGEGGGDGLAVVGSVEGGSPCCGGGEGGSTPPPVRWSESLHQLLDDQAGVQQFTEYLNEECGSVEALQFWFACRGLRNIDSGNNPTQIVTIIWKKFIRNYAVKISAKTYAHINDRINARAIDRTIFDEAQEEVEEEISRSTYPSFLKSERYLNYLASLSNPVGGIEGDSPQTSESSPNSPPVMINAVGGNGGVLPTLHEERELEGGSAPLRLTMGALQATVKMRERVLPESMAGQYLHAGGSQQSSSGGVNPYHASYASAQVVSRQDSELQSLSSDALTDDTHSCTDSSLDGVSIGVMRPPNPKQLKRQYYRARENARQNRELALSAAMPGQQFTGMSANHQIQTAQAGAILHAGVPFLPRTHRIPPQAMPKFKPDEFAAKLIEKLEKVKRDRESQEKVQQSFKRIQEGDNVTDEFRREHAFNSLPPMVLLDKLAQKLSLEDQDPSQAILDDHVSRIWQDSNNNSGARSPGSPGGTTSRQQQQRNQQQAGPAQPISRQQLQTSQQAHHKKSVSGSSIGVGVVQQVQFPSMYMAPGSTASGTSRSAASFSSSSSYQPNQPLQPSASNKRSWPHRNRDHRVPAPDVYSTFSSDSGNVPDYYDSNHLPKSRSMPDTMIDYAGTSSDGGSSGRRGSSSRRVTSRRHPPDLTDSGVSVVSDSGPSLTPSASSSDRVTSWLMESDKFSSGGSGHGSMCDVESRVPPRGARRSSPHTAAGATSPGSLRRSSSRRTGAAATVSVSAGRSGSLERSGMNPWPPHGNLEPLDPAYHPGILVHPGHPAYVPLHHVPIEDKRRSRSGTGHGSSRATIHSSGQGEVCSGSNAGRSSASSVCHGEGGGLTGNYAGGGSGSNVSTLRKQQQHQRSSKHSNYQGVVPSENSGVVVSSGNTVTTTAAPAVTESTTTVFKYHDDSEPYVTRIPTSCVTLKRFKQSLPKKGNYRFFFKKQCEEFGIIQEEITDENEVLPLFEGKIFAQIRKAD